MYQTAVGIISPVEFANEAYQIQYKVWENRDFKSAASNYYICVSEFLPVITIFICVSEFLHPVYLNFSNRPPIMDQKLN